MSDALEKAREALNVRLQVNWGLSPTGRERTVKAIEALVNAILDAREAKAEPDPRDARIAELERERDEAIEHARQWQARKQVWKGCAEQAEAALAELRDEIVRIHARVAAFQRSQPMIDLHDNFIIEIRDRLLALTDPEAKEGGGPDNTFSKTEHQFEVGGFLDQPARDTDPVPATATNLHCPKCGAMYALAHFSRDGSEVVRECIHGHTWRGTPARAAGITGKGTSDE